MEFLILYEVVAVAVDVAVAVKLHGGLDQRGEPQYEEHEAAQEDDSWDE